MTEKQKEIASQHTEILKIPPYTGVDIVVGLSSYKDYILQKIPSLKNAFENTKDPDTIISFLQDANKTVSQSEKERDKIHLKNDIDKIIHFLTTYKQDFINFEQQHIGLPITFLLSRIFLQEDNDDVYKEVKNHSFDQFVPYLQEKSLRTHFTHDNIEHYLQNDIFFAIEKIIDAGIDIQSYQIYNEILTDSKIALIGSKTNFGKHEDDILRIHYRYTSETIKIIYGSDIIAPPITPEKKAKIVGHIKLDFTSAFPDTIVYDLLMQGSYDPKHKDRFFNMHEKQRFDESFNKITPEQVASMGEQEKSLVNNFIYEYLKFQKNNLIDKTTERINGTIAYADILKACKQKGFTVPTDVDLTESDCEQFVAKVSMEMQPGEEGIQQPITLNLIENNPGLLSNEYICGRIATTIIELPTTINLETIFLRTPFGIAENIPVGLVTYTDRQNFFTKQGSLQPEISFSLQTKNSEIRKNIGEEIKNIKTDLDDSPESLHTLINNYYKIIGLPLPDDIRNEVTTMLNNDTNRRNSVLTNIPSIISIPPEREEGANIDMLFIRRIKDLIMLSEHDDEVLGTQETTTRYQFDEKGGTHQFVFTEKNGGVSVWNIAKHNKYISLTKSDNEMCFIYLPESVFMEQLEKQQLGITFEKAMYEYTQEQTNKTTLDQYDLPKNFTSLNLYPQAYDHTIARSLPEAIQLQNILHQKYPKSKNGGTVFTNQPKQAIQKAIDNQLGKGTLYISINAHGDYEGFGFGQNVLNAKDLIEIMQQNTKIHICLSTIACHGGNIRDSLLEEMKQEKNKGISQRLTLFLQTQSDMINYIQSYENELDGTPYNKYLMEGLTKGWNYGKAVEYANKMMKQINNLDPNGIIDGKIVYTPSLTIDNSSKT